MANPLYETKPQITDVYTLPTSANRPIMTLDSNEDMDRENPLYEATQSLDERYVTTQKERLCFFCLCEQSEE